MRGKGRRSIKSNVVARLQGEKFDNGIKNKSLFFRRFSKKNSRFRPSHHVSISRLIHDSLALRHFSSLFPIHVDFFSETAAISIWRPRRSRHTARNSTVAQRQWSNDDDWGETWWMDRGDTERRMLKKRVKFFSVAVVLCLNWLSKKKIKNEKTWSNQTASSKQANILNTLSSSRAPVNNEATLSSSKKIKRFQTQAACIYEVRGD